MARPRGLADDDRMHARSQRDDSRGCASGGTGDFLHLEGNLLIASDLFEGALDRGALSFATDGKKLGVQVRPR